MKITMRTIVPMMKWEIVVVAQSESAPGGGFVRNVHRAGEEKKSTFRHKASSFPGLINRLLPRCKTAAFLEKVFKQGIFF